VRIEISGHNYEVTDELEAYINKRIKKLTKRLNKHLKESAHIMVKLTEQDKSPTKKYEAEIILRLPPKEEMVAKDATVNMFAAVDIAEAKLESQLRKYKEKQSNHKTDRKKIFARMRRKADRDFRGSQN